MPKARERQQHDQALEPRLTDAERGRPSSIAAVQAAQATGGLLAVFSQKQDASEAPQAADLHPVGCAARLCSALDLRERGRWIVLRVQELDVVLRERVLSLTARLPRAEPLLRRIQSMSARELADATIANLPCSVEQKARYASEPSLIARLEYVLSLVERAA